MDLQPAGSDGTLLLALRPGLLAPDGALALCETTIDPFGGGLTLRPVLFSPPLERSGP
jgi:hypothetical protein